MCPGALQGAGAGQGLSGWPINEQARASEAVEARAEYTDLGVCGTEGYLSSRGNVSMKTKLRTTHLGRLEKEEPAEEGPRGSGGSLGHPGHSVIRRTPSI